MPTIDPTVTQTFSRRLRAATWDHHREANQSAFMRRLFAGELPLARFAGLSTQLYFVYAELERVAEAMRADPQAGPFLSRDLTRLPALEADLAHFHGAGWRETVAPGPAARAYVRRIAETEGWPGGLVAHHYTRYLGDLSGGGIVTRHAATTYGLSGAGLRFYAFPAIADPAAFKQDYRHRLDGLAADDEPERERIVAEAVRAYRLNLALLDELAMAG